MFPAAVIKRIHLTRRLNGFLLVRHALLLPIFRLSCSMLRGTCAGAEVFDELPLVAEIIIYKFGYSMRGTVFRMDLWVWRTSVATLG